MNLFGLEISPMGVVYVVLILVKVFAFIDAAMRRADAFTATGKMTKPAWLLILGLAVACDYFLPSLLLLLVGTVAAFVYILDVRPALASVTRR